MLPSHIIFKDNVSTAANAGTHLRISAMDHEHIRVAESVQDFCKSVGIGKTFFYAEVKAGRIRTLKAGRKTLIPASEKFSYLEKLASSKR